MSDVVTDTFTDTDGTLLSAHTGEVGATWTIDTSFGVADGGAFVIHGNAVRRPTFAENPSADGGEALARPSGTLPGGTTTFSIQFDVQWTSSDFAYLGIYEQAVNPPNSDFLFYVTNQGAGDGVTYNDGTSHSVSWNPSLSTWYTVRLDVSGTALEVFIDGVSMVSFTRAAQPIEPFGFDMFDFGSVGTMLMDNVRIYPSAPPAAFWTDYVKTTEVTA